MKQNYKLNKNRSKLFGIIINPELSEKPKEIDSLDRFMLTEFLNNLRIVNVSRNNTTINDFFDKDNTIVLKKSLKRFIDENTLNIHKQPTSLLLLYVLLTSIMYHSADIDFRRPSPFQSGNMPTQFCPP